MTKNYDDAILPWTSINLAILPSSLRPKIESVSNGLITGPNHAPTQGQLSFRTDGHVDLSIWDSKVEKYTFCANPIFAIRE